MFTINKKEAYTEINQYKPHNKFILQLYGLFTKEPMQILFFRAIYTIPITTRAKPIPGATLHPGQRGPYR